MEEGNISINPDKAQIPTHTSDHDPIELLFLGTGNAFSMAHRYWSSILVDNRIILDASPIIVPHLKNLNRKLTGLEYIFITHFHGDHFFGLPFLLLEFAYLQELDHPLTIIGPAGVRNKVTTVTEQAFTGVLDKLPGRLEIKYYEVTGPGAHEVSNLSFQVYAMTHGGALDAYGYSFEIKNKTLGYSGDTDLCDGLINLASHSNILIVEMSNPDQDVPGHMSLQKLDQLQEQAHLAPDTKIILNHLGDLGDAQPATANLLIPNDLDVLLV